MSDQQREPNGFALAVAIFALVVVGVLVTGAFYVARQETRIGVASKHAGMTFYSAENALTEVRANWNTSQMMAQLDTVWADTAITGTDSVYGYDWTVNVTRTHDRMFFLTAQATQTSGGLYSGGTHWLAQVLRIITLSVDVPGALTTHGQVGFKGAPPLISGLDRVPPGWSSYCSGTLEDKTGFTSDDTAGMGGASKGGKGGSGGSTCPSHFQGSPCLMEDSLMVTNLLDPLFEDANWNTLVALADHTVNGGNFKAGPVSSGGVCDRSASSNWGDPFNPSAACGGFFPIVHITGNVTLTGNSAGQGILLVDGDLTSVGTVDYFGVILVRGSIEFRGTPSVYGGILSDSADNMRGTPDILYSSCAVNRAFLENPNMTRLRPLEERSWVDLTNVLF